MPNPPRPGYDDFISLGPEGYVWHHATAADLARVRLRAGAGGGGDAGDGAPAPHEYLVLMTNPDPHPLRCAMADLTVVGCCLLWSGLALWGAVDLTRRLVEVVR